MIQDSTLEKTIDDLLRMKTVEADSIKLNRIEFCKEFVERTLLNQNNFLKEVCPFNYFHIGKNFESYLYGKYRDDFNTFYICCARFLKEYILYLKRKQMHTISPFITSLWEKFEDDDLSSLDDRFIKHIEYIKNKMAVDILNFYFGEDGFKAFKDYEKSKIHIDETNDKILENKKNIENLISNKEEEIKTLLSEKEKSVKRLEEVLNKQKTAFNFVGLSKGFENLLKKKTDAKYATFFLLGMIGLGLFTIPYLYIYFLFNTPESISNLEHWKIIPGFIGLELILLYFFRVVLLHYTSIQTQIIQLELRQSLCQFIQSYADYAKEIKEKDNVSLEKFENIIFSNILSDSNKVPGTFDGIETLVNLIKEIRGGK
ncbi:hypothetical protein M9411_06580 [Pasteurella multocida]|uniref:hypothetical protein n=1 Tax=Pasteurella multocida TaxID=747 RepID=UPI00202493E6|nr:hypothetical protein [Pasteurella multocida]URJ84392.1 hypothetical protein M9411_06580 [Pasteurella multocida]